MTDELLIKFLLKESTPEEDLQIQEWIAASAENQKQFRDFELIWSTSKKLGSESKVDENQAWERFKSKLSEPSQPVIKPMVRQYNWLKVAAVFIIALGAWLVYTLNKSEYTTLTAGNEVKTEILPDGSEITLNKNSELSYVSDFKKHRNIKLKKGEVFFKVVHDNDKPFTIQVNDVRVQDIGTSFNIKDLENKTEVIVETGIVQVSKTNQKVVLHKDQKILISPGSNLQITPNTDQLYNYYRSNQFVADDTPLWRVVEVLNEAYGANIRIENPAIRNLTLNTTFSKNEPLENILQVIGDTFSIKVIHQGSKIVLK